MKINRIECFANTLFIIMGAMFLAIALYAFNTSIINIEDRVETTGIITNIEPYRDRNGEKHYNVFVSYNVNGEGYVSELNVWVRGFYEGKEIKIYYDKNAPTEIGSAALDFMMIFLLILPTIFIIVGLVGIIKEIKHYKIKKTLKQVGDIVYADYIETRINYAYSLNRKHPYNIICEWYNPSDNKKYIFESDIIWYDPENIINERNIETFPVYINRENIEEYVVDIEQVTENISDLS